MVMLIDGISIIMILTDNAYSIFKLFKQNAIIIRT